MPQVDMQTTGYNRTDHGQAGVGRKEATDRTGTDSGRPRRLTVRLPTPHILTLTSYRGHQVSNSKGYTTRPSGRDIKTKTGGTMHNEQAVQNMEKVRFGFVETRFFTRYPCHICGGVTEKDVIIVEVLEGEFKGLRICPFCLESGDTDGRLQKHIDRLLSEAEELRSLMGRIEAPTYQEWQKKTEEHEREWKKQHLAELQEHEYAKSELEWDFIPTIDEDDEGPL